MKNSFLKNKFMKYLSIYIIFAIVLSIYIFLVRPHLMVNMGTVAYELLFYLGLLLILITFIILLVVTLISRLIRLLIKKPLKKRLPWLFTLRNQLIMVLIIAINFIIIVFISQKLAYTPPIVNADGDSIPGSIATLEKIKIGNSDQWITIRGKDVNNPVLLFLAGGPGGSQLVPTRTHLSELENHFVIVNWEQPGSGKSYGIIKNDELTPERYISDAHKLTEYLLDRFDEEKIYILGDSWGSALGIWLANRYPEDYYAFIGSGQMVAFEDTELWCYEKALEIAEEKGDISKVESFKKQGPPPYYGDDAVWKQAKYLMYLTKSMGDNPLITGPGYDTLGDVASPEYGLIDKVNFFRGTIYTFNNVYQQLYDVDFRNDVTDLDIPVIIMHGRHDLNAPPHLVEEYFQILNAPVKELIWYEHSGHNPWMNESDKFVEEIIKLLELSE